MLIYPILSLCLCNSYVGIYGDADPLDPSQWAAMTYSVADDARTWSDATSTCSSMFNGEKILGWYCFRCSRIRLVSIYISMIYICIVYI